MQNTNHAILCAATLGCCSLAAIEVRAQSKLEVVCWGLDDSRQCKVPENLGSCSAITGGADHTIALRSSGEVVCWGSNQFGQCNLPLDLGLCAAVGSGWNHTLAIRLDGTLVGWGDNQSGQISIPSDIGPVLQVSGGASHTLALQATGTVRCFGDNSFGQSTAPRELGSCAEVAAGGFHSVALRADGSVTAWGLNQRSVAVVGSAKARSFIVDARAGVDSVDVLLCGDSNTGYSSGDSFASINGWTDGLVVALRAVGIQEYATALLPISSGGALLGVGSHQVAMPIGAGSTSPDAPAHLASGIFDAPALLCAELSPAVTPTLSALHTTGVPFDFGWVPAQPNTFYSDDSGVYLETTSGLDLRGELIYRVLRSQIPTDQQPGSYFQRWRDLNGVSLVSDIQRDVAGPQYGWFADELVLPADANRATPLLHAACGGRSGIQSGGITGNVGFGLQSVYRRVPGFATQPLEFRGGATMTTIASDVAQMPLASRMTWLTELRSRQIAAGGSGRVIVFIQGGVNGDTGLPNSWGSAVVAIQSALETAWTAIGASIDEITFVAMVSHPTLTSDSNLASIRTAANALPNTRPNLTIVDLSRLTNAVEIGMSGWSSASVDHLSAAGYSALSTRIVKDLLAESGACDIPAALALPASCLSIAAGGQHSVALKSNGSVQAWGSPADGRCDTPGVHSAATRVAAGRDHTLALLPSGEIIAWGSNAAGQCVVPPNVHHCELIAAGGAHTIALGQSLPTCFGDTNADWVVDSTDLAAVLSGWGTPFIGDITGDGMTDGADLSAIFSAWGNCF